MAAAIMVGVPGPRALLCAKAGSLQGAHEDAEDMSRQYQVHKLSIKLGNHSLAAACVLAPGRRQSPSAAAERRAAAKVLVLCLG